tara:strand:+ start:237 stop:449 length:213 start_codon:yes stop_codon:yes gene_type:complete
MSPTESNLRDELKEVANKSTGVSKKLMKYILKKEHGKRFRDRSDLPEDFAGKALSLIQQDLDQRAGAGEG